MRASWCQRRKGACKERVPIVALIRKSIIFLFDLESTNHSMFLVASKIWQQTYTHKRIVLHVRVNARTDRYLNSWSKVTIWTTPMNERSMLFTISRWPNMLLYKRSCDLNTFQHQSNNLTCYIYWKSEQSLDACLRQSTQQSYLFLLSKNLSFYKHLMQVSKFDDLLYMSSLGYWDHDRDESCESSIWIVFHQILGQLPKESP